MTAFFLRSRRSTRILSVARRESGKRKRTSERNCREQERITFERSEVGTGPEIDRSFRFARHYFFSGVLIQRFVATRTRNCSYVRVVSFSKNVIFRSINRSTKRSSDVLRESGRFCHAFGIKRVIARDTRENSRVYVRVCRYRDSRVRKSSRTRNSRTDGRWCVSKSRSCRSSFDSVSKSTGCSFTK